MAKQGKKKRFQLEDFNFDPELAIPAMNYDIPRDTTDDRTPAKDTAKGFTQGFKETVVSETFFKNVVKEALPKGYGDALDLTDQAAVSIRELYNTAGKEIRPLMDDLRRTTARVLPKIKKYTPDPLYKRLEKFTDDLERRGGISDDPREYMLKATLEEVFGRQEHREKERNAQEDAIGQLHEAAEQIRHRDRITQLDAIRLGINQLANYQTHVGANYQRKTLELGYRQYFATVDSLEQLRRSTALLEANLSDIKKNTGLPDFVKQTPTERMAEVMRNSFIDSLNEGFFEKRRAFVRDVAQNFAGSMKERLLNAVSTARAGLAGANTAMDASEMADMSGQSKWESGGNIAGSIAGMVAGSKATKYIRSKTIDNPAVKRGGNQLSYFVDQFPAMAKTWGRSDKGLGFGAIPDFFVGSAKDAINRSGQLKTDLQTDNFGMLQAPSVFTNQVRKSITEIIPGLLSRQLRELQILRTGDTGIGLTAYDYTRNAFDDAGVTKKNIFKALVGESDKEGLRRDADELIDKIDPKKTLSKEARTALAKQMLKDNLSNKQASPERLTDTKSYRGASSKYATEFADLFEQYFSNDANKERLSDFSSSYSRFGNRLLDRRKDIQDIANAGMLDELKEMGLVTRNGSIDIQKLYEYHLDDNYTPSQGPKDPRNKGMSVRRNYTSRNYRPSDLMQQPRSAVEETPVAFNAQPTQPVAPPVVNVTTDNKDVIAAIKEISTVDNTRLISETLLRIEEQVKKGIPMYAGEGTGNGGARKGPWWNPTIGQLGSNVMGLGTSMVSGLWNLQKKSNAVLGKIAGIGSSVAMGGITKVKDRISGIRDVYVEGEDEPRLLAWKMKAGHYRDQKTGRPISSWRQIKGPLVDDQGNVVLEAESVEHIYVKDGVVKKAIKIGSGAAGIGLDLLRKGMGILPPIYQMGFKAIGALKDGLGMALDGPADVYVKGERSPRLLMIVMRHGGYYSQRTRQPVTKISEIDGPIVDSKGNVVLSHDDIGQGLVDKHGKPLRSGLAKLAGVAGDMVGAGAKALGGLLSFGARSAGALFNFGGKVLKGGLGALIGEDGLVFAGSKKMNTTLEEIRDILDARLPKSKRVTGDSDGDGVREGSIEDLRRKRAAMAEKKAKAAGGMGDKSSFGLGGLSSMFSKFFGKKDEDEEEDDDGSLLDDAADIADIKDALDGDGSDGKQSKKGAKGKSKNIPGKKRGFFGRAKDAAGRGISKAGSLVPKIGLGTLARGAGIAGAAYGAYSAYDNIKQGNYGEAAVDAGLGLASGALGTGTMGALAAGGTSALVSGGGALLGALGTAGAVIGGIIASPAFLIGAGIVGVGAGIYYGAKYLRRNKLSPFERLRFAQYGFSPDKIEHASELREFEDALRPGVTFNGEIATLNERKIDLKKMLEIFDVPLNDRQHLDRWIRWFTNRFKPVFITSVSAVNKAKKGAWLTDLDGDKLTVSEKQVYLKIAKFPEGPYSDMTWPFDGENKLTATRDTVMQEATALEASLAKEASKKPSAMPSTAAGAVAGGAAATVAARAANTGTATSATSAPKPGNTLSAPQPPRSTLGNLASTSSVTGYAMMTVTAGEVSESVEVGRLSAITAIRYKTYGLKEMEAEKINALAKLERYVLKSIKYSNRKVAGWTGSVEDVLIKNGPLFGVEGLNNRYAMSWSNWFMGRFLPTYLNFLTSVFKSSGKSDPEQGIIGLKPQQVLDAAIAIYATTGMSGGKAVSVWTMEVSPWQDYVLNQDVKTTDGNMQALKDAAKRSPISEEAGVDKGDKTGKRSMSEADIRASGAKAQEKDKSWFERAKDTTTGFAASTYGKVRDIATTTSNYWGEKVDQVKSAMGFSGGREVVHPGNGTGGDINSLPMPKGSGSYAALKELIDAAARMTGVDPKLMATMAAIESGFRWDVKAGTSSATGLYQFINSTWKMMLDKYGKKYGIDPNTKPTDPRANALMGAEFLKENTKAISGVRTKVTDTDLYLAHFLGAGGAKKFFTADQNMIAAQVMPDAARANKNIFYGTDRPRTFAEVYQYLDNLVRTKGRKFGIGTDAGSERIVATKPKAGTAQVAPTPVTSTPGKPTSSGVSTPSSKPSTPPVSSNPLSSVKPTPSASEPVVDATVSFSAPKQKIVLPGGGYADNASGKRNEATPMEEPVMRTPRERNVARAEMAAGFRQQQQANTQPKFVLEGVEAKQDETNMLLGKTLNVNTEQLTILKEMLSAMISMNNGQRNAGSNTQAPVSKPPTPMVTPSVDLGKKRYSS